MIARAGSLHKSLRQASVWRPRSLAPEEVGIGDGHLHSAAAKEALAQNRHRIPPHQQRPQAGWVPKDLVVGQRLQAGR